MTNRILLHIGAHKTGTTYLQKRWRANAANLRRHGLYFPVLPAFERIAGNAKILPVAIDGAGSASFRRAFPQIEPATLDLDALIKDLLAGWRSGEEDVLLSAETLRIRHAPILREVLPRDSEVVPILFVRAQDDWANSFYNQLVKTGDIDIDMETFIGRLCDGDDGLIAVPDWEATRRAWADTFGNCRVIYYSEAKHDLNGAFATAADRSMPVIADIPPEQVSLGVHSLVYLRQQSCNGRRDVGHLLAAARVAATQLGDGGAAQLITPAYRARLQDRFAASNAALLAALGRANDKDPLTIEERPWTDLSLVEMSAAYARFRHLADGKRAA